MRMMRSQHLPLNPVACANRNGGSSPGHSHKASSSPRSPTNFNSGVLSTYAFSHAERDRPSPFVVWHASPNHDGLHPQTPPPHAGVVTAQTDRLSHLLPEGDGHARLARVASDADHDEL